MQTAPAHLVVFIMLCSEKDGPKKGFGYSLLDIIWWYNELGALETLPFTTYDL